MLRLLAAVMGEMAIFFANRACSAQSNFLACIDGRRETDGPRNSEAYLGHVEKSRELTKRSVTPPSPLTARKAELTKQGKAEYAKLP
jgi:hypothetical protein